MIRDPSDGSVRHQPKPLETKPYGVEKPLAIITSGLPAESTKPDRIERLNKSREWLKEYRSRHHSKIEGQ